MGLFLISYNYLNYIHIFDFRYFSLAHNPDFPFAVCAKAIDAYTVFFLNNNFIYSASHFVKESAKQEELITNSFAFISIISSWG